MRHFQLLFAIVLLAAVGSTASAQRLASFDVSSGGAELAGRRCPPLAPAAFTRNLPTAPAAGVMWFHGAVAAANQTQRLYWCNGTAAAGIQRLPISQVGAAGAVPLSFPIPPVYGQVTGMVVDPGDPQGRNLWVTNGNSICLYRAPGGAVGPALLGGPWIWPGAGGNTLLTGLSYDVFSGRIIAVDHASDRYTFDPITLTWGGPLGLAVAVPGQATGIQVCLVGGAHFITYSNGTVMNPDTGLVLPFPPAPGGGVRGHQGLTYMGQAVLLGGASGGPGGGVGCEPSGNPWTGNQGFGFNVDPNGLGQVFLAVDINGQAASLPIGSGTAYIDPVSAVIIDLGSHDQPFLVPLPLPTGALGTSAVVQFGIVRPNGELVLSDAYQAEIYRQN